MRDYTEEEMLQLLTEWVAGHMTHKQAARQIGVSAAFLSDVLQRRRAVGPTIAAYLGFERIVIYRHKASAPNDLPAENVGICSRGLEERGPGE